MQNYRIAVLPGDGIGPEVMDATLQVLRGTGLSLDFTSHDFGADHFRRTGIALPQRVVDDCLAVESEQVDLASGISEIASEDSVAELPQGAGGGTFRAEAEPFSPPWPAGETGAGRRFVAC